MRSSLLLYLWVFSSWSLHLQAQTMGFQHITTREGLSDNAVTCILEDRSGHIWIGTERGLDRYDGQRMESFRVGIDGPPGAHVTSLAEDGRGRLWITTTNGGLGMRDPVTGKFTHYNTDQPSPRQLPTDLLNHVLCMDDGTLVLSSQDKGAVWFDPDRGLVVRTVMFPGSGNDSLPFPTNWCHSALSISATEAWFPMIHPRRSWVMDLHNGHVLKSWPSVQQGVLTNGLVLGSILYAGGWEPGLDLIPLDGEDGPVHIAMDDAVTCMIPWDNKRFLCGTEMSGLWEVEPDGGVSATHRQARHMPNSLPSDRIRSLLRDRSGNLWVGTAKGLAVHAPDVWQFSTVPLLPEATAGDMVVHALQQDVDGTIRIATSRGFLLVDPEDRSCRRIPLVHEGRSLEVTGLHHMDKDLYFIGTETGFHRYDPRREKLADAVSTKGLLHHGGHTFQIRSLFLDTISSKPSVIAAALGHSHSLFDLVTGEYLHAWRDIAWPKDEQVLLKRTVRSDASVYWSGLTRGLMRWEPVPTGSEPRSTHYRRGTGPGANLPGDEVSDLLVSGDTVWAAFRDGGLGWVHGARSGGAIPPAHLPNDLLGMARDAQGRFWCTTSSGLLCHDPRTRAWLHLPINDGSAFNALNGPILLLQDGRMACTANNQLITFDPALVDRLPVLPTPRIARVANSWGDLAPDEAGLVHIAHNASAFDAWVTALATTGPTPLTFLYRMEGIDHEPRTINALDPIRYTGIPPGSHRLLVRVRDAYGRIGPEHHLLTVNVAAPFWQRWWFFALVFALGASGMYVVARYRLAQRLKLQALRDNIARDLHDDIGSTLGSINYYSEALKRKLEQVDDEMAREVADRIGNSSRSMIDQMNDIVWSVDPTKDDARSLEDRIRNFAADLTASKGIQLHFASERAMHGLSLGAQQRRNLFLIAKEAIHNCVKYAACTELHITLERNKDRLLLTVMDNGIGFDQDNTDSYNGNGLTNMARRAEAIGGELRVESTSGQGTRVTVSAPFTMAITRTGD